jgi:hypothetical protein
MTAYEALILYILCLVLQTVLGAIFDQLNFRLGQPWYKFPSKKEYYITFLLVAFVFTISYWMAFLLLPLIV